jgi:hypothetical protein
MIKVKDDILNEAQLSACNHWLDSARWSFGWPSNENIPYGHWNIDVSRTPPNNTTDISERLPNEFKDVWKILNKEFFKDKATLVRCYANRQTFGTEGYIHTDTEREEDQTIIIYMNKEWSANLGGETTFYSFDMSEIIDAVLPRYGRTVIFNGNIPHCARSVTRICDKARTTLMFKSTIDPKAVYPVEEIYIEFLKKIGADKLPHKVGTLADHLLRTFYILKSKSAVDVVALAGGLHSVYSTNAYKTALLPKEDTQIKELFGEEVDRLVRLFGSINRPEILENPDGSLNETDLFLLQCIECANLYDQNELDPQKYPHLCEVAKMFYKG